MGSFKSRLASLALLLGALACISLACDGKQGPAGPDGLPVTIIYIPATNTFTPSPTAGSFTFTPTPTPVHPYLGQWGTLGSGNGQFSTTLGIAVDSLDNIYVADSGNNRIQVFTASGIYATQWGIAGSGNGQFNSPLGIAVDSSGNVYVADTLNSRIQKFT